MSNQIGYASQGAAQPTEVPRLESIAGRVESALENLQAYHANLVGIGDRLLGAVPVGLDKSPVPTPTNSTVARIERSLDSIRATLEYMGKEIDRLSRL